MIVQNGAAAATATAAAAAVVAAVDSEAILRLCFFFFAWCVCVPSPCFWLCCVVLMLLVASVRRTLGGLLQERTKLVSFCHNFLFDTTWTSSMGGKSSFSHFTN